MTSGDTSDSDRWQQNVGVGNRMWACQAMQVKRQKLRIIKLYANEQRISRAKTSRSEESVSSVHTSPSRVQFRSDFTVLYDLTATTYMDIKNVCIENKLLAV